jgi:hypothetical protein
MALSCKLCGLTVNATARVPAMDARYTNVASARCGCTMFLHCNAGGSTRSSGASGMITQISTGELHGWFRHHECHAARCARDASTTLLQVQRCCVAEWHQ